MPDVELWSVRDWEYKNPAFKEDLILSALKNVYAAETIFDRFDALAILIEKCNQVLKENPRHKNAADLKKRATEFAMAIVDAKDDSELAEKIAARNKYKTIDPEYMPWNTPITRADVTEAETRPQYLKQSLRKMVHNIGEHRYNWVNPKDAASDEIEGVGRLTEMKEREPYRIFISDGRLKQIRFDGGNGKLSLGNFDTQYYQAHGQPDKAIFVVSPKGDLFANVTKDHEFYHSTFLGAGAAFYAGTLTSHDGNVTFFDPWSGHYKPEPNKVMQMLTFLREAHLINDRLDLSIFGIEVEEKLLLDIFKTNAARTGKTGKTGLPDVQLRHLEAKKTAALPKTDLKRLQEVITSSINKIYADTDIKAAAIKYTLSSTDKDNPEALLYRYLEFRSFNAFVNGLQKLLESKPSGYSDEALMLIKFMIKGAYQNIIKTDKTNYFELQFKSAVDAGNKEIVDFLLKAHFNITPTASSQFNLGGAAILTAVRNRDVEMVQKLLEHKANPNHIDPETGDTPLLAALKQEKVNEAMVKLLLENKAIEDPRQADKSGLTPLMIATQKGLTAIVEKLLALGVDTSITIESADKEKLTAYDMALKSGSAEMIAVYRHALAQRTEKAINNNDSKSLAHLIASHQFDPNQKLLLCQAVKVPNSKAIVEMLLNAGVDINQKNDRGSTALMLAIATYNYDVVELLLQRGANVNAKGANETTALHVAAVNGNTKMAEILLKANADPTMQIQQGQDRQTAEELAIMTKHKETADLIHEYSTLLPLTKKFIDSLNTQADLKYSKDIERLKSTPITRSNREEVLNAAMAIKLMQYCDAHSTDPFAGRIRDLTNKKIRPHSLDEILTSAVITKNLTLAKLFLDSGLYNPDTLRDSASRSLLFIALGNAQPEMVDLVVKAGANVNQLGTDLITTPLAYAFEHNDVAAVKILLDNGVDIIVCLMKLADRLTIDQTNILVQAATDSPAKEQLQLALQQAIENGQSNIVKLLITSGMDPNQLLPNQKTPLFMAAEKGYKNILSTLLNARADLQIACMVDGDEMTPLDVAKRNHHKGCVELIDHLLVAQLRPMIDELQVTSKGTLRTLQLDALSKLRELVASGEPYESASKLLNAYRKLEILAKNIVPYKVSFFNFAHQGKADVTDEIHKAVVNAYTSFNSATTTKDVLSSVDQLDKALQTARSKAVDKSIDVTFIDQSIAEINSAAIKAGRGR